tara:strand:- start:69 stop:3782 length:3714 start_codon:yes stop_codon:yes gene_type:complete
MSLFDRTSITFGAPKRASVSYTSNEKRLIYKEAERVHTSDYLPEETTRIFKSTIDELNLKVKHPDDTVPLQPTPMVTVEGEYEKGKKALYAAVMQLRVQDPYNKKLMAYPTSDEELQEIVNKSTINRLSAEQFLSASDYDSWAMQMLGSVQAHLTDTPMLTYMAAIPVIATPVGLLSTAGARIAFWVGEGMIGGALIEKTQQNKNKALIKKLNLTLDNSEVRQDIIEAGINPDNLKITQDELDQRFLYAWASGALLGGTLNIPIGKVGRNLLNKIMRGDAKTMKLVDDAYHDTAVINAGNNTKKMNQGEAMLHIKKIAEATKALQHGKKYVKKDYKKIEPIEDLDKAIKDIETNLLDEGKTFNKKQSRKIKALMDDYNYNVQMHNAVIEQKHLKWNDNLADWELKVDDIKVEDIFTNAKILQESFNQVIKQKKVLNKIQGKYINDRLKEIGVDDIKKYQANLPKDAKQRRLKILNDNAQVRLLTQLIKHKELNPTTNIGRYMSMQKLSTDFLEISFSRDVIPGNVASTQRAIFQDFMNRLDDPDLHKIKWSKISKHDMNNIVKEMYGESTGDVVAAKVAKKLALALEDARVLHNHYGGNLAKRRNYFPQHHNQLAIGKVSSQEWINFTKQKLDKETTAKNLNLDDKFFTDGVLNTKGDKELDRILDKIHESIATGEQKVPFNSLSTDAKSFKTKDDQMRYLIFDTADDFLAYQAQYGKSPMEAMYGYFNHMSNDIAFRKVFGPNIVQNAKGINQFAQNFDALIRGERRYSGSFDRLFDHISGTDSIPMHKTGNFIGTEIRAGLVTAQLGSAYLASLADISFGYMTRNINGMKGSTGAQNYIKYMAGNKHLAREANIVGLEIGEELRHGARIHGDVFGNGPFSWMANNLMKISLLQPGTIAARTAFKYEFQFHLRNIAKKSFNDLDNKILAMYKRYGITKQDHEALAKVKLFKSKYDNKVNYLRVSDIEDQIIRQKFYTYMFSETEAAVPSYMARSRADMMSLFSGKSGHRPGTGAGELARAAFLFKNFPMTIVYTHLARTTNLISKGQGGAGIIYATQLMLTTGTAGYLIMNARKIMNGEDTTTMNPSTLAQGLMYGGGLGIFGDMFLHDSTKYGQTFMGTLAGPVWGLGNDVVGLMGLGEFQDALYRGKDSTDKWGGKLVSFLDRYTPYNNLWYTRAATDRLIFDNMRKYLDVNYQDRIRRHERRLRKEGREFFIDRQSFGFKRMPKFQLFDWKNY